MSFSSFLDLAWTHVLSQSSAMGNPYEFREIMKAAFGYSDKTVEQVQAELKARDKPGSPKRPGKKRAAPTLSAVPRQSEVDKMQELLSKAKPRPKPVTD